MRLLRAWLLLLIVAAWGCKAPASRSLGEIPIEQTPQGRAMSAAEKASLLELARRTVTQRAIRSIRLHSWYHPGDLPVATVVFEPAKVDEIRYEFTTLTVLNRNWRRRWDTSKRERADPPETCWYLEERSRRDQIKQRFPYRGGTVFLSVAPENTHAEMVPVLRIFERGRAIDWHGKMMRDVFAADKHCAVRKYTKDGEVFVEVLSAADLSERVMTFRLVGGRLILETIRRGVA